MLVRVHDQHCCKFVLCDLPSIALGCDVTKTAAEQQQGTQVAVTEQPVSNHTLRC